MTPADEMLRWLDGHTNLETVGSIRQPTLDRIRALLRAMNDPQDSYPIVHVTGTNGKTSTARLTARILTEVGLRIGCYTSPHLTSLNERMACDGLLIADDDLGHTLASVADSDRRRDPTGSQPLSYFEALTAAAFTWFAQCAVDGAVIEVGLGGTWDATNVARGQVAVVTNVGLDHTEYLGPTRRSIATEKAGIIKPGATLVLGETDRELDPIFQGRGAARTLRSPSDFALLHMVEVEQGQLIDLRTPHACYRDLLLPVHGHFQADNATVAVVAAESFVGGAIPTDVLRNALTTFETPGRMEILGRDPLVILDGAHNVTGAQALMSTLTRDYPARRRTLVVGMLRDKDTRGILAALNATPAETVIACAVSTPRAHDPESLVAAAVDVGVAPDRILIADTVADAIRQALRLTATDGQVVVTGSLYVVGEARQILRGTPVSLSPTPHPARTTTSAGGSTTDLKPDQAGPLTVH